MSQRLLSQQMRMITTIDLKDATGVYTLKGGAGVDKLTGSAGVDTIDGAGGDDIITIAAAGKGDTDVMDGGADADVLQLSTGAHAFADNDKLKNIETIKTASGGSEVDLSAQTEALRLREMRVLTRLPVCGCGYD